MEHCTISNPTTKLEGFGFQCSGFRILLFFFSWHLTPDTLMIVMCDLKFSVSPILHHSKVDVSCKLPLATVRA